MKRLLALVAALLLLPMHASAEDTVWTLVTMAGEKITAICYEPEAGDQYISGDHRLSEVVRGEGDTALLADRGAAALPAGSGPRRSARAGDGALPCTAPIATKATSPPTAPTATTSGAASTKWPMLWPTR